MQRTLFKVLLAFIISFSTFFNSKAQNSTISGTVKSAVGELIPGVNIQVKGTSTGTVTDNNGAFKINVNTEKTILVVSAIGFATQELTVGNRSKIDVILQEDVKTLNEVIVTALGIKREEKSLGFAAQTINANAVIDAKSNNWVNTLSDRKSVV